MLNKQTLLVLLLTTLTSCSTQRKWCYQEMVSHSPDFQSTQASFIPENIFSGLGVQFIKVDDKIVGFFNIYSRQLQSNEGILWINNKPLYFCGHLLEGKQRLQLPEAVTKVLIKAITDEKEIVASIDNFTSTIPGSQFKLS